MNNDDDLFLDPEIQKVLFEIQEAINNSTSKFIGEGHTPFVLTPEIEQEFRDFIESINPGLKVGDVSYSEETQEISFTISHTPYVEHKIYLN